MTVGRFAGSISRRPDIYWALFALLIYTLAALLLLYPVPFQMNAVIAGEDRGDAYQYTWSLWWAKQALFDSDKGLAHLTLMNHPVGLYHPFMLTLIGVNLGALPFSLLLSPAAAYNSQIILSFILSGMTMYWLTSELTGDRRAGVVGGFVFAFFLNKTGHVLAGHLPQATVFWVPLYTLFLWRLIRKPSWGLALLTALLLALASLIHVMHLVYLVLPVTAVVLLVKLVELKREFFTRGRLGALALAFGLAALLAAPFLLPTARAAAEEDSYLDKPGIVASSTDLAAFFTPSPYHPVLEPLGLVPPYAARVFPNVESLREGLAFGGLLVTGLALWGLIDRRKTAWIWAAFALLAALLSLGPLLKIGGELAVYEVEAEKSNLVLPYALFRQLPILQVGRTPGRLNEATMFAVAILAAFGAAALFSRLERRPRTVIFSLALILVIIGFEYIPIWPFPTGTAEIPPAIHSIASEPGEGALLHLAMTRREVNHRALYYQTLTGRAVVGGQVHRTLPETPPWWETLSGLALPDQADGDIIPRPETTDRVAWLRHFDIDYVIVHRGTDEWHDPAKRGFLEGLLGPPKYEDHPLAAYTVPGDAHEPTGAQLYSLSSEGWHPPERDGGLWRRWMGEDGQLYLYSRGEETGSLRFTVDSHLDFPLLEVYLGEELLDTFVVGERTTFTSRPFTLAQGMNVLRFQAPGDCEPTLDSPSCWSEALLDTPADPSLAACSPDDLRTTCRTFVFDDLSFVPQEALGLGEGLDVNLGDRMRLRGWELDETTLRPGTPLKLTLAWEAVEELNEQYVVFVHLLSNDGALVAQYDGSPVGDVLPVGDELPTSAWPPGATFSYPITIELPHDLPAGDYRLLTGVYIWPSLERLPVLADIPGAEVRAVELGSVRIEIEP
jgi:hypothetical protein